MTDIKRDNEYKYSYLLCAMMIMVAAILLIPDISYAAANHAEALKGPYEDFKKVLEVWGARTIALTAFAIGAIGCVLQFRAILIIGAFGTAIIASNAAGIVEMLVGK